MRKYLIATHGSFAGGIRTSLEMIAGKNENLFIIEGYGENSKPVDEQLDNILKDITGSDELFAFTDLMGGSITNQLMKLAMMGNVYLISGVNLPLLLEIILAPEDTPAQEIIESAISNARDQIVFVNKLIPLTDDKTDQD
jgi:fructoselysine and glucoselysine-specific PTS system IIA component